MRYRLLPYAGLAAAVLMAVGCAKNGVEPELAGVEVTFTEYEPDLREHHTSWGHHGRGGAALRKPTYQHVLGSPDTLMGQSGPLKPPSAVTSPSVPQGYTVSIPSGAIHSLVGMTGCDNTVRILVSAREYTDEYIAVRNKLCAGAERLTYKEWEILVSGTPKDVPESLKAQSFPAPESNAITTETN